MLNFYFVYFNFFEKLSVKERYNLVGLGRAGSGRLITDIDLVCSMSHIKKINSSEISRTLKSRICMTGLLILGLFAVGYFLVGFFAVTVRRKNISP